MSDLPVAEPPALSAAAKKKAARKKKRAAGGPVCEFDNLQMHKLQFDVAALHAEQEAASSDSLCRKVNSTPDSFCFAMRKSEQAGRFAVATRALPTAGSLVLRERAYAFTVRYQFIQHVCQNCAQVFDLNSKSIPCTLCEQHIYCSAACQQQHSKLHAWQCSTLQELEVICTTTNADVDLIRAALCVVAQWEQDRVDSSDETIASTVAVPSGEMFSPSLSDVDLMVSHEGELDEQLRATGEQMAAAIRARLPNTALTDTAGILRAASLINANAHSLCRQDEPSKIWGIGLFPLSSMFNHSCYPNMQFCSDGAKLLYRTLRPVQAGEELTINYTALYQSRASRRAELATSKSFFCRCRRCELQPVDEDQRTKFTHDQFLSALKCTHENCAGFLREYVVRPPKVRKAAAAATDAADDEDSENDEQAPAAAPAVTSSATHAVKPLLPVVWICSVGGPEHQLSDEQAQSIVEPLKIVHDEARAAYMAYASKPGPRTVAMAGKLRAQFETVHTALKRALHPDHELCFSLMLVLINCCSGEQDYRAKTEYARQVIAMADAVHPKLFLPLANYQEALAQSLQQHMDQASAAGKPLSRAILQRYREEQAAAYRQCIETYKTACGADHMVVKIAQAKLDAVSK